MKSKRRPARIINVDQPFRGDILLDETSEYIKLLGMMRIIFKSSHQSCTDRFLVTIHTSGCTSIQNDLAVAVTVLNQSVNAKLS